jgi:hypothetical protein
MSMDSPASKRSPYIRSIREVVENDTDRCMIFEWMDGHGVLLCIQVSLIMDPKSMKPVNTLEDVNPNNILVSEATSSSPLVKPADLEGCKSTHICHRKICRGSGGSIQDSHAISIFSVFALPL